MKPILIALMAFFAGCATPASYSTQPLSRYDKDTTYRIDEHPKGFAVTVYYSRYQFIPESDALAQAAKSALLNIALETADARGRQIERVDDQRIRMSMGRNGITGTTSWSGTVKVFYKGSKPD